MTGLMFSLTLGFIIFLRIVSKIPFALDLNDHQKGIGVHSINMGSMNLPLSDIESLLKKHEYAF